MTLVCSGKRTSRLSTLRRVAPWALAALLGARPHQILAAPPAPARATLVPAPGSLRNLLLVRLRSALSRLFEEPEKILEIGIRKPPKEVEESRAELRRFFRGATLESVEVPFGEGDGDLLEEVRASLTDLTLLGMRIDRAVFTLRRLLVDRRRLLDTGELAVRHLGSIHMAFEVTEEDLDAVSGSYDVGVRPGRFRVRGRRRLLFLPLGFVATGRLAFTEGGDIVFHDRAMHLNGLPLPGIFRSALRRRINPIFDLEEYLGVAAEVLAVRFLRIRHGDGRLALEAEARVDIQG